ncbi:MAG: TolC family protein [Phycisphaerales bacterium]
MARWGTLLSLSCLGVVAVSGCTNPFGSDPMDYDQRVSREKAREVRPLRVERYAAPTDESEDTSGAVAAARARFEAMDAYELTLEEARAATLTNNLGLQATLVSPTIAEEALNEEEGRFNAVFTLSGLWSETDSPTSSTLAGSQTRTQSVTPGVRIPLHTGGTASINLPVTHFQTDNTFSTLNPAVTADLEFSLSHNLLRGAGRRATMHSVRIADYNRQISEVQTKLEVIRELAAVDRAFWRLYAAREALLVRIQQYELGDEQLSSAERQLRAGSAAEIEVIRARSGRADRIDAILQAQNEVLLRERDLKAIVNIPGLDVDTAVVIVPASPPEAARYDFDRDELLAAAIDNRMELLEDELRLAMDAASIAFARNEALPLLALSYTYRINGLGGTEGQAFSQLDDNKFEDWSVGLQAEVPLGNEQRRAAVAQAVLTRLQRLSTREARRQSIRQEVLDAADRIDSGWQRILASRESVILNTRALDAERRQFGVGRSTSNDVLDADTRLAEARLTEIQAIADYQISQVDLAFAAGLTLGASKVIWDPRDPRGTPEADAQREALPDYSPVSGIFTRERDKGDEADDEDGQAQEEPDAGVGEAPGQDAPPPVEEVAPEGEVEPNPSP